MGFPLLSSLIWLPVFGAITLLLFGNKYSASAIKWFALSLSILIFGLSVVMYHNFDITTANMQFIEHYNWIEFLGISYYLGVDGISMLLVALTAFTHVLVVLAAWRLIKTNVVAYYAIFLLLQAAVIGVFCALDAILFYVFWEAMLIPMYLCIGIWGSGKRSYAAIKFFLYTFFGSTLLLIALLYLGFKVGTFNILSFYNSALSFQEQILIFIAFFLAFAVKVPMWPMHTWLPDAHTEAPAGGSVILAALMLKVGAYGFFRFCLPVVPLASSYFAPAMIVLSLFAIVYIGFIALAQTDMKRLIAYSSVAHMGFVTLGLFAIYKIDASDVLYATMAVEGAMVQMIAHAFGSGAMFLAFGIIYDKLHTRTIDDFGGVATKMPYFAAFFMIFALSNIGLPGTAGFVGEFLVIVGVFKASFWLSFFAAITLIVSASYTLWMYKRVFYGTTSDIVAAKCDSDVSSYDQVALWLLVAAIFAIGLYPQLLLSPMHATISNLVKTAII
jgi:NADH-quinone oxidoreductase subunit M